MITKYTNGLIFNQSPGVYAANGPKFAPPPSITTEDLLILATRLPIDDDEDIDRRSITKSGTDLEVAIFDELSKVFDYCSRQIVLLSKSFAENLDKGARQYLAVKFNVKKNAYYNRYGCAIEGSIHRRLQRLGQVTPKEYEKTLGYIIYIPEIQFGERPSLLTSFGMNGMSSMLWNFAVKTYLYGDVRKVVNEGRPHIIVGEFSLKLPDNQRPSYLSPNLVPPPRKIIDMDFELR